MTGRHVHKNGQLSNVQARIVTGVLLAGVVLWLTWFGNDLFTVFSILTGAAVFYEWNRLVLALQNFATQVCGWVCYVGVAIALLCDFPAWVVLLSMLVGAVILALLAGRSAGWIAGGLVYAALLAATLSLLRQGEVYGFSAVCFLFAVVWGTDIGAYFFGRALGGPKLAPKISPRKTWSGAVCGAAAGIAAGSCVVLFMMGISPASIAIPALALLLSVISQIGDLGESWIKRYFHVKDSGNILPGHGGVMDRVDGLQAAAVALYITGALVCGMDNPSNLFHYL